MAARVESLFIFTKLSCLHKQCITFQAAINSAHEIEIELHFLTLVGNLVCFCMGNK